jgi:hypothetical protein
MAISEIEIKRCEKILDSYLEKHRPPPHIRNELDISYRIKDQSIEIFEIRPSFQEPKEKIEIMVAKTTYIKRSGKWKIYWHKSDMKWHGYDPIPEVNSLEEFITVLENDEHCCFYG